MIIIKSQKYKKSENKTIAFNKYYIYYLSYIIFYYITNIFITFHNNYYY